MFLPNSPRVFSLSQGDFQPLDGQGILGTDVDVAHCCADRMGGNRHALDDAVRVTFQHAAVHERTGVAFVGVADDELPVAFGFARKFPFAPCGETGATAASQARGPHRFDHGFCAVLFENLGQGLITFVGDVVFNGQGIDDAAVAQDDFLLSFEEVHVGDVRHGPAVGPLVDQSLDYAAAGNVLGDDFFNVLRLKALVKDVVDHHHGAAGTGPLATGADDRNLILDLSIGELFFESFADLQRARGDATGAQADADLFMALGGLFGPFPCGRNREGRKVLWH